MQADSKDIRKQDDKRIKEKKCERSEGGRAQVKICLSERDREIRDYRSTKKGFVEREREKVKIAGSRRKRSPWPYTSERLISRKGREGYLMPPGLCTSKLQPTGLRRRD